MKKVTKGDVGRALFLSILLGALSGASFYGAGGAFGMLVGMGGIAALCAIIYLATCD